MPLIEMPSGLKGEFRELTLADQDALAEAARPKAPKAMRDKVIERMLRDCWITTLEPSIYAEKMPNPSILDTEELLSGDRLHYLVKMRNASWGSVVIINTRCKCGQKIEQGVDLSELEVWPLPESSKQAFVNDSELFTELPVCGRTVWWRLLTGTMEHHAAKIIKQSPKSIASEALALRVTRVSDFNEETRLDEETGEDVRGWLRTLTVRDADHLRHEMMDAEGSIETVIEIPCQDDDCLFDVTVDVKEAADFFGPSRVQRRRKRSPSA